MKEVLLIKRVKNQFDGFNLAYDPTCFDHNLHIRLKKYVGDELIAGFEQKLIFLVEYFLQKFMKSFSSYSVDFNIKDESDATKKYIFSKYINEFKQSNIYKQIVDDLSKIIDFEDIVIKSAYSKKESFTKESQFGNIQDILEKDSFNESDIDSFCNRFNCSSVRSFLLDDSISLLLTEVEDNLNEKYINKNARKIEREIKKGNNYQESKLW